MFNGCFNHYFKTINIYRSVLVYVCNFLWYVLFFPMFFFSFSRCISKDHGTLINLLLFIVIRCLWFVFNLPFYCLFQFDKHLFNFFLPFNVINKTGDSFLIKYSFIYWLYGVLQQCYSDVHLEILSMSVPLVEETKCRYWLVT